MRHPVVRVQEVCICSGNLYLTLPANIQDKQLNVVLRGCRLGYQGIFVTTNNFLLSQCKWNCLFNSNMNDNCFCSKSHFIKTVFVPLVSEFYSFVFYLSTTDIMLAARIKTLFCKHQIILLVLFITQHSIMDFIHFYNMQCQYEMCENF